MYTFCRRNLAFVSSLEAFQHGLSAFLACSVAAAQRTTERLLCCREDDSWEVTSLELTHSSKKAGDVIRMLFGPERIAPIGSKFLNKSCFVSNNMTKLMCTNGDNRSI